MSRDASVEAVFGGDERRFRLRIGELLALEERRGAGVAEILNRISSGQWFAADVTETLRLALMGGGMDAKDAKRLVEDHAGEGGLFEAALVAKLVLVTALVGHPKDAPGKRKATTDAPEANASPPSPSTEPAP